jgi:hypothetical protein
MLYFALVIYLVVVYRTPGANRGFFFVRLTDSSSDLFLVVFLDPIHHHLADDFGGGKPHAPSGLLKTVTGGIGHPRPQNRTSGFGWGWVRVGDGLIHDCSLIPDF